jgi:dTDP-4-dehydrorhamnose 3,5-epimerase
MPEEFVQDNHSRSARGTLRGLHYQLRFAQSKLCRVVRGAILDVAVDLRRGSPTFGRWVAAELSEDNHRLLYIPRGCAHGFVALTATAELLYKCSEYYHPEDDYGIAWNDPELAIDWGGIREPRLSPRDRQFPPLKQVPPERLPVYGPGP